MDKKESEQKIAKSEHSIEILVNQISKLRKENHDLQHLVKDILNDEFTETQKKKLKQQVSKW